MKKLYAPLTLVLALSLENSNAQSFMEEFDDISTGIPAGWDTVQRSSNRDASSTDWFQGNPAAVPIYSGTGYIAANYLNSSTTGIGTISNWLISPVRTLNNGDVIIFNTSCPAGNTFPDRMQVRVSQAGTSSDVGIDETTVGDFTMLVTDINPTYLTTPSGGYPGLWTRFSLPLSGLPGAGVSGRFAFRYFVENSGNMGSNGNYIGIDSVAYVPFDSTGGGVVENKVNISSLQNTPNPAASSTVIRYELKDINDVEISLYDIMGKKIFSQSQGIQTQGKHQFKLNVSELPAGMYFYTLTAGNYKRTNKMSVVK